MAISTFPVAAAGGGGRTDLVFSGGSHTVSLSAGYYIVQSTEFSSANDVQLSEGFQKLPAVTSLRVGPTEVGENWTSRTSGFTGTNDVETVTYGDGLFVAGGDAGELSTSTDGITWTARTSGESNTFRASAYGDGVYIVGSTSGFLATSTDGVTWTSRTSGTSENFRGGTYADGRFVFVGDNATIITSTDGITWTTRSNPQTAQILTVFYGDGLWITGGAENASGEAGMYSFDTITWTLFDYSNSGFVLAGAYGNGLYLAGGDNGRIFRSTDGINWTRERNNFDQIKSCVFTDGVFVFGDSEGNIVKTTDGLAFETFDTQSTNIIFGLAFGEGLIVAGKQNTEIETSAANFNSDAGLLITELPDATAP